MAYCTGMHPDVTWGDSLGYLQAAEKGFDPGTNANSHFLYLLFCRSLIEILPWFEAQKIMALVSVFWALLVLLLSYLLGKSLKNEMAGLFALHILACAFTFWRHACIIEVYTMELAFWAGCFWFFLLFLRTGQSRFFYALVFCHATGLLVHIHLLLFFPAFLYVILQRKPMPWAAFFLYVIPVAVVFFSVFMLNANTLEQVFFDAIGDEMTRISLSRLAMGILLIPGLLVFSMPLAWLLIFLCRKEVAQVVREWKKDAFILAQIPVMLTVLAFAWAYASPGIHVFLLPVMLFFSLFLGCVCSLKFPEKGWAAVFPALHILLIFNVFLIYSSLIYRRSDLTEIKGGPGYLLLPWARGNASSILETAARYPLEEIPSEIRWNVEQARQYLEDKNRSGSSK
jgi:hypothetical protein